MEVAHSQFTAIRFLAAGLNYQGKAETHSSESKGGFLFGLIASVRVPCRGVFSQLKRCRVRNTTCQVARPCVPPGFASSRRCMGGGSVVGQMDGGCRLFTAPIPGNGLVFDPTCELRPGQQPRRAFVPMTVFQY